MLHFSRLSFRTNSSFTILASSACHYHPALRALSTPAASTGAFTISDALATDHRELEAYYSKMLDTSTTGDLETRQRYQNQFSWLLAKHVVGEEIVVYPAYEKYLGALGHATAVEERASHQRTKEDLEYFQRIYPHSDEFEPKLRALMKELSKHIKKTEHEDLPKLESALVHGGKGDTMELAKSFRRTQMFLPSRAHPWQPNEGTLFETVSSLLATPIDVLGDMFRRYPEEEDLEKTEKDYEQQLEKKKEVRKGKNKREEERGWVID
ncbi:hypothetical protein EDC01DRAFT_624495 [Geopyxis carbonaria]|nr:hypothetical protein EDC01DRAFT_624495 [Geopyxis carbonaria]